MVNTTYAQRVICFVFSTVRDFIIVGTELISTVTLSLL